MNYIKHKISHHRIITIAGSNANRRLLLLLLLHRLYVEIHMHEELRIHPGLNLREVKLFLRPAKMPCGDVVHTRGLGGGRVCVKPVAATVAGELDTEVPRRLRPDAEVAGPALGELLRRHGGGARAASNRAVAREWRRTGRQRGGHGDASNRGATEAGML